MILMDTGVIIARRWFNRVGATLDERSRLEIPRNAPFSDNQILGSITVVFFTIIYSELPPSSVILEGCIAAAMPS